jgi:uncharacterized damage-inducible protein DinB
MNADAFRHFYGYHFSENRALWDKYIMPLSEDQFTQDVGYSHGSVRDQVLHIISADDTWFSPLCGEPIPDDLRAADFPPRSSIRRHWDKVEGHMREYLSSLRDEMLNDKPYMQEEDKELRLWQVLLHVVNHGTDHRAQILRLLNDLGVKTVSQDYIFYVYEHP